MQKLIAILFLLLLGSATLLPCSFWLADAVEQLADNDKGKEVQPEKKEGKEFLTHSVKRFMALALTSPFFKNDSAHGLPKPVLNKPTPPPDVIC